MTAGKSCRGTLACCMGIGHTLIEKAVLVSRALKRLLMGGKPVVDVGKHATGNIVDAHGTVVILRTCHGKGYIYNVVGEKRREDHKRRPAEVGISPKEVKQRHHGYHREIGGIAHVHQLAHHRMAETAREKQRRLTAEHLLLPGGEKMVEIRKQAVKLIRVRIPPRQQCHLRSDTAETRQPARPHPVHQPQGSCYNHHPHPAEQHRLGIVKLGVGKENK